MCECDPQIRLYLQSGSLMSKHVNGRIGQSDEFDRSVCGCIIDLRHLRLRGAIFPISILFICLHPQPNTADLTTIIVCTR